MIRLPYARREGHFWKVICIAIAFSHTGCTKEHDSSLSRADVDEIRQVIQEFSAAWLADDRDRVMRTLTEDAVLIPHHGHPPVAGADSIAAFWWPAGPAATVTLFDADVSEIAGSGKVAYAHGRFRLAFEYQGAVTRNDGNYLMAMRKDDSGWRIARRIWNDRPSE